MSSTERLNTLRNLVTEMKTLCSQVESDTKELEDKISESREEKWMWFCTTLAPYLALVKEIKPRSNSIYAETGVDDWLISFDTDCVTVLYNNGRSIKGHITDYGIDCDFKPLSCIVNRVASTIPESSYLVRLPKEFKFDVFEKSFVEAVEKEMAFQAEQVNETYERTKEKANREEVKV